jgi:hypothetical protein
MHSVHSESRASEYGLLQCLLGLTLFANHSLYTSFRKGVPEFAMTAFISESKFISEHGDQAENFSVIKRRMLEGIVFYKSQHNLFLFLFIY